MVISEYQKEKTEELKRKAVDLYKSGYTFREVSKVVERSHEWVRQAFLSTQNTGVIDKN